MQRVEPNADQVRQFGRFWLLAVGLGVLSIIVGAVVLAKPDNSLRTFAVIVGIFILLDGIVQLVEAIGRDTTNQGLALLLGLLNLIVGILLIRHPIGGVQAVALFLGIWLIAAGMVRFAIVSNRPGNGRRFVLPVLQAVFGIVIVANPHIGFTTLAIVAGLAFIANGLVMIAFGLLLRSVRSEERPRRPVASARTAR